MEREDDLIDLGSASIETKGNGILTTDEAGKRNGVGLSND